jgi:hypothetical protein
MFALMTEHQPDGMLANFRSESVCRFADGGSTFSGVEPSNKAISVQLLGRGGVIIELLRCQQVAVCNHDLCGRGF